MSTRDTRVSAGEYLMIGRFLDTGAESFTRITDLSASAPLPDICYRAMSEIGRLDPERYDFVTMLRVEQGAARVVLTKGMLYQYVRTHWL